MTSAATAPPTESRSLAGRVALITGAGSGLGRATALRLARGGAHVVATDVRTSNAEQTAAAIADAGGDASAAHLDITDSADVARLIGETFDRFGPAFDCLVNNAGTDRGAGIVDITDDQWHSVIAVNQTGPLFTTREFVRHLCKERDAERDAPGDIVNVLSISAITVGS